MQLSTDNANFDFSPTLVSSGYVATEPADTPPRPTTRAPQTAVVALIDWKTCPPDGTEQSLQAALRCVAQAFQGKILVALRNEGGQLQQYGSQDVGNGYQDDETVEHRFAVDAAVAEALHAREACLFASAQGQSSLVLQQLRQANQATLVLGFGGGKPAADHQRTEEALELGIVVCIPSNDQLQSKEAYAALIATTQHELSQWCRIWQRCRVGTRLRVWQQRLRFYQGRRGQFALLTAGLLLASLALPLPYWPQRVCVVEPAKKSYVSSPIDGRIRGATVRPGDVVMAGQLLARLDAEQLQWQISAAEAEYEAAGKKRDTALATRAGGELRLAQLEQERIAVQIEALERQLERLELRSPSDGVVVQGDWFQSDGAAVTRGDMLFEIAEMDRMRVEIHLSSDDLARLHVGNQATVRVDAAPGMAWSAELNRIDPRGKVIDAEVVFGATIEVDNDTNQLRPGMQGTARITAGTQSLGWLLFHRPLLWARNKLAW